jgi:hypothetical protein
MINTSITSKTGDRKTVAAMRTLFCLLLCSVTLFKAIPPIPVDLLPVDIKKYRL